MAESIITVKRQNGFTVLPNKTLRDNRLSLKTRAILAIMISMPSDWDYTVSGLATICGVGKYAVRTSLRELEGGGYLTRVQRHDETGHFSRNEYIVTDEPTGEGDPPLSGYPSTGGPLTAEPLTGNPTQQNKDNTNTPYSPPGGACAAGPVVDAKGGNDGPGDAQTHAQMRKKREPDWTLFDRFWAAYPLKKCKDRARRAWKKINPDLALCRIMSDALEKDKRSRAWLKDNGAYIPYPASWLNGRRWEDEHEPAAVVHDASPDAPLRGEGVQYQ